MKALVFDDLGRMWSSANMAFEEAFSVPKNQASVTKYAVKPLGFVAIDLFGQSAQIRCALPVVAEPALAAAFAWLRQRRFERIAIDYYDGDWKLAVARSSEAAIALLSELMANTPRCPSPQLMLRRLHVSELQRVPSFARLHAEWQAGLAGLIPFDALNLAQRHLGDRYVVYELAGDGQLYFTQIGRGFNHFGSDWTATRRGLPITAQPDPVYAAWIAGHYREALDANAARFDDFDVFASNATGRRVRFRLKRIILPVIVAGRPPQLIGGSVIDERIDLRLDALNALLKTSVAGAVRAEHRVPVDGQLLPATSPSADVSRLAQEEVPAR